MSETTGSPGGRLDDRACPLEQDDGAEPLRALTRRLEPVGVDPARFAAEQPRELAGMRRQHRRLRARERLEPEQGVGVDDDGQFQSREQRRHERVSRLAPAEARSERDRVGPLGGLEDPVGCVVPAEAELDRLEGERLDDRQALARNGERRVAGVRPQRGHRAQHRRARRPG